MRKFRYLLSVVVAVVISAISSLACASGFANETLHYTISYKWGLIHKDAGKATLSLSNSGNNYELRLTARTLPWADRVFQVRDTLLSTVSKTGLKVKTYQKITHEGGKFAKDALNFSHSGSKVTAAATRNRQDKKGNITKSSATLTGEGEVFDMLSVFYYLRTLDFSKMQTGHAYVTTIFSGTKSERLTIRCKGKESIKMRNKTTREAYKLTFSFTRDNGKKSSDGISAWVSTDSSHIPLYMTGKLPFGEVRVYLD